MCKCKYCNREFKNIFALAGHSSHCKLNPKYDEVYDKKIRTESAHKAGKIIHDKYLKLVYTEETKYCLQCGKEIDKIRAHKGAKFCNSSCAAKYINQQRHIDQTIYEKTKIGKCKKCGKEILIKLNSSNCYCDECKHKSELVICKLCGSMYHPSNGCENEFCKTHNMYQIKNLIKYFGFDKSKLGTPDVGVEFNRIREIFIDMYINKHMSMAQIGEHFNYKHKNNLSKIFKYMNIKRRTRKEISLNIHLTGRASKTKNINHYKFKQFHHKTWYGKDVFLRSSYEYDYANELDVKKIMYDVEALRIIYFDTKCNYERTAYPDFFLPETNTIVEVKSIYTLDVQNIKDKFKRYKELGYNVKLLLEHEFVDLYKLPSKFRIRNKEIIQDDNYHIHYSWWTWIVKNDKLRKCNIEDLDNFIKNGWVQRKTLKQRPLYPLPDKE